MTNDLRIPHRGTIGEGGDISRQTSGALPVPSFTDPEIVYEANPETGWCSCPGYKFNQACEKHPFLAGRLQDLSRRRFATRHDERVLFAIVLRIYAPLGKRETPQDSYRLFMDACGFRYSTKELKDKAKDRHKRVLARADLAERSAA